MIRGAADNSSKTYVKFFDEKGSVANYQGLELCGQIVELYGCIGAFNIGFQWRACPENCKAHGKSTKSSN